MLELPAVTLCCIDTAHHELAVRALRHSADNIRFARTLFLTDREIGEQGIDVEIIEPLDSRDAYSEFVLKRLLAHIDTRNVLLAQWDGYVVNPAAWREEFLVCDYIGAKWFWYGDGMRVGNGGFSLRSRKLLAALQDPRIVLSEAEDVTIGRAFRPLLEREFDIRFATEALADVFAFEAAYPIGRPFGFHGLFNFCRVVPPDELANLVRHFTPAIARSPQLLQLGRNCIALGQWRPAEAIFRRILDEQPGHAEATAAFAAASANAAAPPTANRNDPCPCGSGKRFKNCHGALAVAAPSPSGLVPPDARLQLAIGLHQSGDLAGAESEYVALLAQTPGHPVAEHYLGVIRYQQKDLAGALPLLERSVAKNPDEPEFHNNLGLALAAADRDAEAIDAYRATLKRKPDHAIAWNNLGLAQLACNDAAGAIDAFRHAIALVPGFTEAHWNLSLPLLLTGAFDEGWREYEWRLALDRLGKGRHVFPGRAWDGKAPAGKTLLLYTEQGLGDALQFARFVTPLAQAGARAIVHSPPELRDLLATVPGVDAVVSAGDALPAYDAHCPLVSLPRFLGSTLATLPAAVPYVTASIERRAVARAALAGAGNRLRVGVAWAGSKANQHDRNRSMPLAALAPLFDLPDVAWYSLQKGEAEAQVASLPNPSRLISLGADNTFDDTAALVAELDLVLSVCTSIAHLAGALARPVWVMLAFAADWRWLLDRDDSPWYPTARLFRQPSPRDWTSVVTAVGHALRDARSIAR